MIALRWHVLRLPLLLSLLWCLLLFALFQWTVQREDENATELAQIQSPIASPTRGFPKISARSSPRTGGGLSGSIPPI